MVEPCVPVFFLIKDSRRIPLEAKSYVIGRGTDVDILFDRDLKLSRRHARLVVSEDGVDVEDLGSMNGTWVNSYLVQHRLRVTGRSVLKLGDVELLLEPASAPGRLLPIRSTRPEGTRVASEHEEITTQQTAAFEHAHLALVHLIDSGRVDEAKRILDPILATVELGRAAPSVGALDTTAELALRVALAARDASYVDTVVRIHCAHSAPISESNLELLGRCLGAGLDPDPRNVEVYLALLGDKAEHLEKLQQLEQILEPSATMPSPGPLSEKR